MARRKKNSSQGMHVLFIICLLCLLIYYVFPKPPCSILDFEKRAVWITYDEMSELSYNSKSSFHQSFNKVLDKVIESSNNTVIVHVRAFSDALYTSSIYPFSKVMSGQSALSFDPLKEMVELSHQRGIYIEAWINPYRISLNKSTYYQFYNSKYKDWLTNENLTIKYGDYKYILNPESSKVRKLIVDGVKEIIENYDVDGIHFDDYFYVEGTQHSTTQQQRLDNVNKLVRDVYTNIKVIDQEVTFGISPQGNYENCLNHGADVDTWLKEEGYVDYLMPQLYWSNNYDNTPLFSQRAKLFSSLKRHDHVKIYAGLALHNAGKEYAKDKGWSLSSNNISNQVQILSEKGYDGYSLFSYTYLSTEDGQKEMNELLKNHP